MRKEPLSTERPWQTVIRVGVCLLCMHPSAMDAQDSLLLRDYDYVKSSAVWTTSQNTAALTTVTSANISRVEVTADYRKGSLADYSDGTSEMEAGAVVGSLYRVGRRTVMMGEMRYRYFSGKEMGGSALMNSRRLPFDIVEDSLTNLGEKHRDSYFLSGGVGVDVWRGVSLGARMDYTAANYAKYKDLRHKNKLMDMKLAAGVFAPIGKLLWVGANYYYQRTTESVTFSTYGKDEKVYKSLINYGPYIGKVEQFANNGFTERSREMPMVDDYNGAAVQLGLRLGSCLSVSSELTYAHRKGYYGRKSPYTITFSHHRSDVFGGQLRAFYSGRGMTHHLHIGIQAENLANDLSTYREKTNDSGANYYEYYDDVKAANKLWVNGHVGYVVYWRVIGDIPVWTVTVDFDWMHRKQTGYVYPYYRIQKLDNRECTLGLTKNYLLRRGILSLTARGSFLKGRGQPYEDLTFVPPSDKQILPASMEAWLYREYRWLTAAQYTVGGSVKYTFVIPSARTATYVRAGFSHRKAKESCAYCAGRDRLSLNLAVGCTF